MRTRHRSRTCSNVVWLLFESWTEFCCLLSTKSTLACAIQHLTIASCDCRQLLANSTLANSDLGDSVLAGETVAQNRDSLELLELANCLTFANSANCLPIDLSGDVETTLGKFANSVSCLTLLYVGGAALG